MQGVRGVAQLTSPMSPRPANPIPTGPSRPGTATPRPGGFPPNPAQRPPVLNPKGSTIVVRDPGGRFKSTSRPGPRDTLTIRTQIPGAGEREARLKGSRVPLTGSPTLLNAQKQIPTPGFFGAVKAFVKSIVTKDPIGAAAFGQLAFGIYARDLEAASLKGQPADPAILQYILEQLKQDGLTLNAQGRIVPAFQVPGPARDC